MARGWTEGAPPVPPSARPAGSLSLDAGRRPRIVLFSGGTACRSITIALARMNAELTRVVPAWDSGGSSKVLREAFAMPPVGDIRQALMTMAHGEGRAGSVVRICNARLSDALGNDGARAEFEFYADSEHPLLRRMAPELGEAIIAYLELFRERLPADFDFRNGSIGNFVMTGAYFAHGDDINAAIRRFRALCAIDGHVWPASTLPDLQLSATLKNGGRLGLQHLITRMSEADSAAGIADIELTSARPVVANDAVLDAIARADLIAFGPGSFYTSILPHLLVDGVAGAVAANLRAPKVFIGNILECAETRGMDLAAQVEIFLGAAERHAGRPGRLLTHVLGNAELFPFDTTAGRFRYLRHGDLDAVCGSHDITHAAADLEDVWTRGHHDGRAVGEWLMDLAASAAAG